MLIDTATCPMESLVVFSESSKLQTFSAPDVLYVVFIFICVGKIIYVSIQDSCDVCENVRSSQRSLASISFHDKNVAADVCHRHQKCVGHHLASVLNKSMFLPMCVRTIKLLKRSKFTSIFQITRIGRTSLQLNLYILHHSNLWW